MNTETWLPVPGHPGYEVSNQGRVQSSPLYDSAGRLAVLPVPVAQSRVGSKNRPEMVRYFEVSLRRVGSSERDRRKVHHLVCEAFHGPRPPGLEACHNDGDPDHNAADNLRWDTHTANMRDLVRHNGHFWANRTECLNGHDITDPANCYTSAKGRKCKTCQQARARARHDRLKGDPAYEAEKARYRKERYERVKDDPEYKAAVYERNRKYMQRKRAEAAGSDAGAPCGSQLVPWRHTNGTPCR